MALDYIEEENEATPANEEDLQGQQAEPVTPYYSIILIALIGVVWLVQMATSSWPPVIPEADRAVVLAGFVKPWFLYGEYWRILTAGALHSGIMHLAFNSYALYVLGKPIEYLSNRSHLAIVFVLAIIGGGILSLIFLPENPSVGASGGVIGFLGYLTAYGFKRRKLLPSSFLKNMLFNIGVIAVFGIFIMPNIDNFGHLGGLLVGLIYGLIQVPSDLHKDPREVSSVANAFGYVSIGIFLLTCIYTILLLTGIFGLNYDLLYQ